MGPLSRGKGYLLLLLVRAPAFSALALLSRCGVCPQVNVPMRAQSVSIAAADEYKLIYQNGAFRSALVNGMLKYVNQTDYNVTYIDHEDPGPWWNGTNLDGHYAGVKVCPASLKRLGSASAPCGSYFNVCWGLGLLSFLVTGNNWCETTKDTNNALPLGSLDTTTAQSASAPLMHSAEQQPCCLVCLWVLVS